LRRNTQSRAAQARTVRLAERRRGEEALFAAAADALATIDRTVGSLDLAVDMANEKLLEASVELQDAVRALGKYGYQKAAVAAVLGIETADLRPGLTLALRRSHRRPVDRRSTQDPDYDPALDDDTETGPTNGRNPS
jgi:hypothetical protein